MQVPVKQLNKCHPEHQKYHNLWKRIDILNEGGVALEATPELFLQKPAKQLYEVYSERIQKLCYTPLIGTIGGWYGSALFRRSPEIDAPADFNDFLENCDRASTHYSDLWRDIFDDLFLFGRAWVQVDLPSPDIEPSSLLDEQEQGLDSPYLVVHYPGDIINWAVNEVGELEWVLLRQYQQDNDFLGDLKSNWVWTYYDRTGWKKYTAEADPNRINEEQFNTRSDDSAFATLVDQGTHALSSANMVPFRLITIRKNLWIGSRCYHQLTAFFNEENALSFSLYQSNFAFPVVYSADEPNMTLGAASYIKLNQNDKMEYLEPKGGAAQLSHERLGTLKDEIFRAAYLVNLSSTSSQAIDRQSSESKKADWKAAEDILNSYGDVLRLNMKLVLKMVALAKLQPIPKFEVRGFKFENAPAESIVALADEIAALQIQSPTLRKSLQKAVAQAALEDYGPDVVNKACSEIDASPEPQQMMLDQAGAAFNQTFDKLSTRATAKSELSSLDS